jgi:prepilin-type N-terminal cleavage/methylation domain-containing protein
MYKQIKKEQGFTIIEVLIVLAIAGLILLIVFLAVPALQRNARNQQRKTDAAAILAAVSEFQDNNNGQQPTAVNAAGTAGVDTGNIQLTCAACSPTAGPTEAKVGIYNSTTTGTGDGQVQGTIANGSSSAVTDTFGANSDYIQIVTGASCTGTGAGAGGTTKAPTYTTAPGSTRQFVVLYGLETGATTWSAECTEG